MKVLDHEKGTRVDLMKALTFAKSKMQDFMRKFFDQQNILFDKKIYIKPYNELYDTNINLAYEIHDRHINF
jgi:hypothetical protein